MNADPIAKAYRFLEYVIFGTALQRTRTEFINELPPASSVLVLGEGDGRFLAALLEHCQPGQVQIVDNSLRMLNLARSRIKNFHGQLHTVKGDARTMTFAGPFDLVATHFFFDCFYPPELPPLVSTISQSMTTDACWLVSEFAVPRERWTGLLARMLLRIMYLFFRVTSGLSVQQLPDYTAALEASGFVCQARRLRWRGFIKAELWKRSAPLPS